MLATYAQRGPRRPLADRMLACTIGAPEAAMLCLDLAIFDGGAAERFLTDRGHLLRDDERELLARWLTAPLDLYEVTWVRPGSRLKVRSLIGGPEEVEQQDRLLSLSVRRLDLMVARLLPDGTRLRALGGLAWFNRDKRRDALELFACGPVPPIPADRAADRFPERLLTLYSQPAARRFTVTGGEEYRWCETTVKAADPTMLWRALARRCRPLPQPPIRSLDSYRAFCSELPPRWWCETVEDEEIELVGSGDGELLLNLGTVRRERFGRFALTANSASRIAELEALVLGAAPGTEIVSRSVRSAEELLADSDREDPSLPPPRLLEERARHGVEVAPAEPSSVVLEQYFIPLGADQQGVVSQITREHHSAAMLDARDADGLTPAEALASGGAARDRVLALLGDCEWRLQRQREDGQDTNGMPDPDELRRRLGLTVKRVSH
jgi:hypothetical protein